MSKKYFTVSLIVSFTALFVMSVNVGAVNIIDPVVTTVAGGIMTNGSNDATGTSARFSLASDITTDGTNLYVADTYNHTIRKVVITTGEVTTLAGIAGVSGFADGPGLSALFNYPQGITTDGANLYVTDTNNGIIRKIVIDSREVSTVAGTLGIFGLTDAVGPSALFGAPHGITTDGENLYLVDTGNSAVRKIVIETGNVTTLARTASDVISSAVGEVTRYSYTTGIATDGTYLYVADNGHDVIYKISIATGEVMTLAGKSGNYGTSDGAATVARFHSPQGLALRGTSLYVADNANLTIRKIDITTGNVSTLTGTAGSPNSTDGTDPRFFGPLGMTTDGTSLYVTDMGLIRRIQ